MALIDDLQEFLRSHNQISQTRQNLQNDINLPDFDVQDALAEVTAGTIISSNPGVFSAGNLLDLKNSMNSALSQTFNTGDIGANRFFDGLQDITNMNFLFNPEGVFDFIRPLANDLGYAVTRGLSEVDKLSALLTDYNTFIQAVPRVRLDSVTNSYLDTVKGSLNSVLSQVQNLNTTFDKNGLFVEDDRVNTLADIDTLFSTITSGDDVMPEVERFVREITDQAALVKQCLQDCVDRKGYGETFVDNFENDANLRPYQRQSFGSAETIVEDLIGQVDAVVNNDNQFQRVNLQSGLAQGLQAAKQLMNNLPEDIPGILSAAAHRPTYDTFQSGLLGIANTNLQSAIDGIDDIVKKTQITVVRDINTAYGTDISTFTTLLGDVTTDLSSISSVVEAYAPALTDIGKKMDRTVTESGLDRLSRTLTQGGFFDYSGMIANDATEAGKLAQTLAEEIQAISDPNDGGKKISFELARNILIGVHQTQLIASRAIRQEVPGAVSQLSKQDEEVQKAANLIEPFLA